MVQPTDDRPTGHRLTDDMLEMLSGGDADIAFRRRVRTIMRWIPPSPDRAMLDVPCGRGFYLRRYRFVEPRCRIVGTDVDPEIIDLARRSLSDVDVPLTRSSLTALPFAANSFDAAICSEVLEHLDDDVAGLREVRRILRPGGLVAITVPHANYPFWWDPINKLLEVTTGRHIRRGPFAGIWAGHVRLYSAERLRSIVQSAEFEIVDERSFTHHCMPFSHNLVYGFGKPILERSLLPKQLTRGADRHVLGAGQGGRWNPVSVAIRIAGWFDRWNVPNEPAGRSSVNLAVLARKPGVNVSPESAVTV